MCLRLVGDAGEELAAVRGAPPLVAGGASEEEAPASVACAPLGEASAVALLRLIRFMNEICCVRSSWRWKQEHRRG